MSNEPVAWMHVQGNFEEPSHRQLHEFEIMRGWKQYPLYTHPIDDTALLRQALDCLENHVMQRTYAGGVVICNTAIALRERLGEKT
jgi:hypothetical protein